MYKIVGANQTEYGPITAEQLRQWITEGRADANTRAKLEGTEIWKPLGSFPEFADLFARTSPSVPPSASVPPGTKVPNYLVQAILCTICCCLPGGIVAIVYAAQVNGKLQAGDIQGATEASRQAKLWCWISFGVGIAASIVWLVLQIVAVMMRSR